MDAGLREKELEEDNTVMKMELLIRQRRGETKLKWRDCIDDNVGEKKSEEDMVCLIVKD